MSTVYVTNDGERITAETARDLINKLRKDSRDPEPSIIEFKTAISNRVRQQTGIFIPTDPEDAFVAGLIVAGLLTKEQE